MSLVGDIVFAYCCGYVNVSGISIYRARGKKRILDPRILWILLDPLDSFGFFWMLLAPLDSFGSSQKLLDNVKNAFTR